MTYPQSSSHAERFCRKAVVLSCFLLALTAYVTEVRAFDETVGFAGVADVAGFVREHPGWSDHTVGGGALSIIKTDLVLSGKALRVDIPRSQSGAFLRRALPQPSEEIWVAFTMRVMSARPDCDVFRSLIIVAENGRRDLEMLLRSTGLVELSTQVESEDRSKVHLTGYPWWPDRVCRYVIGFREGKNGFVRFYADGARVYEFIGEEGGFSRISRIEIGGFDTVGTSLGGSLELADIRISSSFEGMVPRISPTITVTDRVLREVNFDCFGLNPGYNGQNEWYPAVYDLQRTMRFHSFRYAYHCTECNWDGNPTRERNPNRNFWYGDDGLGSSRSFLYSSFRTAAMADPLLVCILNHQGERGSRWDADKAVEWVKFNQAYRKPDGSEGLRVLYEAGNETSLPQFVTEGWWYDGKVYVQIGSGCVLHGAKHAREVYPLQRGLPSCLSNHDTELNYRLTFDRGRYLYLGFRWKFTAVTYALANAAEISPADDARLDYEYWDETHREWRNFNRWVQGWDTEKTPHFLARGDWNRATFEWRRLEGWGKRSMREESEGSGLSLSAERLYYIRLSHHASSARYTRHPVEKFVMLSMPAESYIEILKHFAPVRKAGGELYAWVPAEGDSSRGTFEQALAANPGLYDGLVCHFYSGYHIEPNRRGARTHIRIDAGLWAPELVGHRARYLRKAFPGRKIGVTEWNHSGVSMSLIPCLANGLRAVMTQCEILKGGWDFAMYHTGFCNCRLEYSYMTSSFAEPRLRPTGLGLKMVRDCARKYLLDAASNDPGLYVCAFRGGDANDISLVVVNRTGAELVARVNLPAGDRTLRVRAFSGRPDQSSEESDVISFRYEPARSVAASSTHTFPPYSATAFEAASTEFDRDAAAWPEWAAPADQVSADSDALNGAAVSPCACGERFRVI